MKCMICKIPALIQNETEMGEKRGKRPGMRRREREIRGKRVMGERERERERETLKQATFVTTISNVFATSNVSYGYHKKY